MKTSGAQQESEVAVRVRSTTVGRTLALNVTVNQPFQPVGAALLTGVVTSTPKLSTAKTGQVVYRINNIPVRVVEGETPFFRGLSKGVHGPDVLELQAALGELGYLSGEPSGRYDATTIEAVKKWQADLHQAPSGVVKRGELVAVPRLPAVLRRGDQVALGQVLAEGTPSVLARTGGMTFQLVVSDQQTALIPGDATVSITWKKYTWPAVIAGASVDPQTSNTVMTLAAPGGGLPCADSCDDLPPDEQLSLRSQVAIVPETTGPAVPAAAVHTRAAGTTYVVMADRTERDLQVKASANGLVIVAGVQDGDTVLAMGGSGSGSNLPAPPPATAPATPPTAVPGGGNSEPEPSSAGG